MTAKKFCFSLAATALLCGAAYAQTPAPKPPGAETGVPKGAVETGSELPYYMIPNIPEAAEAYWSPDNRHLIAQTRDPAALKTPFGGLGALTYIFSDDGKEVWRVNDRGQDACSFFFPDGKRVVFTSTRDNMDKPVGNWSAPAEYPQGGELYSADLDGKNIKRLTNNDVYEAEVSVSPDGQWIAFGRQIKGNMDIWVMKSDGTEEHQVTKTKGWQEGAPFFMKDNNTIIFRAWRTEDAGKKPVPMTIFSIAKDGTNWRRHTFDGGMNWHPTPAPDGRHYVYVRAVTPTNWEIFMGDLAGDPPRRLTYNDQIDILAHISPNGKKMNWGRATGQSFMSNIKTFVMDISSLDVGPEKYVPFDPTWGEPMPDSERK